MKFPEFFKQVKTIKLTDPLSETLGAFEQGEIEFRYVDIVKTAGHSCATVAGAYLSTLKALEALYAEELPQRGNIKVEFADSETDGVIGVIANVIENITGATLIRGFKGIGGKRFIRHSLMSFDADIDGDIKFTRLDTGKSVTTSYNAQVVPPHPNQMPLMQKIMQNQASASELDEFKTIWQNRVKQILIDNFDNQQLVVVKQ